MFFLQAEDGIRDGHVTGVQTCALPIFAKNTRICETFRLRRRMTSSSAPKSPNTAPEAPIVAVTKRELISTAPPTRSEERRVGKECRPRSSRDDEDRNDNTALRPAYGRV